MIIPHLPNGYQVGDASKFLCVKAEAILEASPEKVYSLFVDNSRVREYNEFCKQIKDLEYINSTTKVLTPCSTKGEIPPASREIYHSLMHDISFST